MHRRRFLNLVGAGTSLLLSGLALGREKIERFGPPRFHFGLAAYSLRNYFAYNKGKPKQSADDGPAIDMFGFIDYCAANGFDAAELTSYFFPPDLDDDYLRRIKRQAFERGVMICGTAIGNNFTVGKGPELDLEIAAAKMWIDRAAVMGAPMYASLPAPEPSWRKTLGEWTRRAKRSTSVPGMPLSKAYFWASRIMAS